MSRCYQPEPDAFLDAHSAELLNDMCPITSEGTDHVWSWIRTDQGHRSEHRAVLLKLALQPGRAARRVPLQVWRTASVRSERRMA